MAQSVGSATGINIRRTITEGSELVVQLDTLSLAPHSQVTWVNDVRQRSCLSLPTRVDRGGGNDALGPANLQKRLRDRLGRLVDQ